MNKEQQELLDDSYKKYCKEMIYHPEKNWLDDGNGEKIYRQLSQEEFINKCKTDSEFSEEWGLKIEERDLSWQERRDVAEKTMDKKKFVGYKNEDGYWVGFGHISPFVDWAIHRWLDEHNIPTKLITVTYINTKIESYE